MHHDSLSVETLSCACNALRKASRAVTRFYDEIMEETDLSLAQFAVLWNIAQRAPVPLMDLAHILVMDRTTFIARSSHSNAKVGCCWKMALGVQRPPA
jgi:hypothetical protein